MSSLESSRRPDRDRLERQVRQTDEVQPGHRQPRGAGNGTQHPRRNHQRLRLHGRRHIWYNFFYNLVYLFYWLQPRMNSDRVSTTNVFQMSIINSNGNFLLFKITLVQCQNVHVYR